MRVVELFCGAGGMGYGLTKAGMTVKRAYDNSPHALKVHHYNVRKLDKKLRPIRLDELRETTVELDSGEIKRIPLAPHTVLGDLNDLTRVVPEIIQLRPDVVVGGPPCQEFSKANRRRKEGLRAVGTFGFAITVALAKPKYFIMENVPNVSKSDAYARSNSVPPPLAEAIGRSVLAHSRGEQPNINRPFPAHFRSWLGERYSGEDLQDRISSFRTLQEMLGRGVENAEDRTIKLLERHPAATSLSVLQRSKLTEIVRLYDDCTMDCIEQRLPPYDEWSPEPDSQ